jgi:hypothetical protein
MTPGLLIKRVGNGYVVIEEINKPTPELPFQGIVVCEETTMVFGSFEDVAAYIKRKLSLPVQLTVLPFSDAPKP